jgi:hypothetical protein
MPACATVAHAAAPPTLAEPFCRPSSSGLAIAVHHLSDVRHYAQAGRLSRSTGA